MKIARTDRFKKAWRKLSAKDKRLANKAIENLTVNMSYPSLRVKRIKGTGNIWEARASQSLRITFQLDADTIVLRNIRHHDEALGQP